MANFLMTIFTLAGMTWSCVAISDDLRLATTVNPIGVGGGISDKDLDVIITVDLAALPKSYGIPPNPKILMAQKMPNGFGGVIISNPTRSLTTGIPVNPIVVGPGVPDPDFFPTNTLGRKSPTNPMIVAPYISEKMLDSKFGN